MGIARTAPLEAKLRSPVEWYSSGVCLGVLGILYRVPHWFFLDKRALGFITIVLLVLALWRAWQGYQVVAYQCRLWRLPDYKAASRDIPVSEKRLFLGKGFRWQAIHTQRRYDLQQPLYQSYKEPSSFFRYFQKTASLGGDSSLHGVALNERNVWMDLVDRGGHMLVVGTTGVGKTRFAEVLLSQDIRRGDVVIVIDPKGDAELLHRIASEACLCGRSKDVRVFHLGFPDTSARYNPVGNFTRITEVANRIANQLPGQGSSAAFKAFGWKFINSVTKALVAMGIRPNYKLLNHYLHHIDALLMDYIQHDVKLGTVDAHQWIAAYCQKRQERQQQASQSQAWVAYSKKQQLHEQDPIIAELVKACEYDKTYYDKITASLSPLLDKLTSGQSAHLLTPNYSDIEDTRPILDWTQAIAQKQIIYVGLDALTDSTVATATGNAILADLVSVAGRIYNYGINDGFPKACEPEQVPTINLHVDEANEVIGDEFIPLLNKARGAGFRVTAYTQTTADIEARLESRAKTGQVLGNLGTVILFRVKDYPTAQTFVAQLPQVPVTRLSHTSSVNDVPSSQDGVYFSSHTEDKLNTQEVPLINPNDILNLPKGQAFAILQGGHLYKLRMPLPKAEPAEQLPMQVDALIRALNKTNREEP